MKDIFLMSVHTLRSYKLRSFLTLLGVIIGIGAVIIVTSAGESVSIFIEAQWNIFDPTGMIVGTGVAGNPPQLSINRIVFTSSDVDNISELPHVRSIAPIGLVPTRNIAKRNGFLDWERRPGQTIYCSSPEILSVLDLSIGEGTVFREGRSEVIISAETAKVFGEGEPLSVGDTVYFQTIDGSTERARIVGILEPSKNFSIINQFMNPSIIGPVDPFYTGYLGSKVGGIFNKETAFSLLYATATDRRSVVAAQTEILDYLQNRSSDASNYKDAGSDFVVLTQQYILQRVDQLLNIVTLFITAIALISLIVGGIGIANIMFATVTERTREIGIMMAVGAKRRDVLRLFLYQSTMIGMIGALLGCVLGIFGTLAVVEVIEQNMNQFGGQFAAGNITVFFAENWIVLATIVGIITGVVAGVLPALKAARMDPVVALRHE